VPRLGLKQALLGIAGAFAFMSTVMVGIRCAQGAVSIDRALLAWPVLFSCFFVPVGLLVWFYERNYGRVSGVRARFWVGSLGVLGLLAPIGFTLTTVASQFDVGPPRQCVYAGLCAGFVAWLVIAWNDTRRIQRTNERST